MFSAFGSDPNPSLVIARVGCGLSANDRYRVSRSPGIRRTGQPRGVQGVVAETREGCEPIPYVVV